jgi:hypothetical protein
MLPEEFVRAFESGIMPGRDLIVSGRRLKEVCDAGLSWKLPEYGLNVGLARNPFSRFISGWLFAQEMGWIPSGTCPIEVAKTYAESEPQGYATLGRWIAWRQTWLHCCRQPMWTLYDPNGILVMDMVLRQESLQDDFDLFRDRIERPRIVLPYDNASVSKKPWREWYEENPGLKEVVADLFAPSLEPMGYVYGQDEAVHDCLPQISPWVDSSGAPDDTVR